MDQTRVETKVAFAHHSPRDTLQHTRSNNESRWPIRIVLLLYFLTACAYAWLNPVFEAPDEPFHVAYANLLVRESRWPQVSDIRTTKQFLEKHTDPADDYHVFNAGQSEIFLEWAQPPLYYMLQTIPLRMMYPRGFGGVLIPVRPQYRKLSQRGYFQHDAMETWSWRKELLTVRLMRLFSVFLGVLTVWTTAKLARLVVPNSRFLPIIAAAFLAFVPQFTFMTASVNNDVAGYLIAAVTLGALIRMNREHWSWQRSAIIIGLCLGIALLAKRTTIFLWPMSLIVLWMTYRSWNTRLVSIFGTVLIGAITAGWFYAGRLEPQFDLLAFGLFGQHSKWITFSTGFLGSSTELSLAYLGKVLKMLGESFWGQFGWFQVRISPSVLIAYWLLVATSIGGWLGSRHQILNPQSLQAIQIMGLGMLFFILSLIVVYSRLFVPQGGRYILVMGPVIAIVMAWGLLHVRRWISDRFAWNISELRWAWGAVAIMVGLNWIVLLGSIYAPYTRAWSSA